MIRIALLMVLGGVSLAMVSLAQDDPQLTQYVQWMKTTGKSMKQLKEQKTGPEAATAAEQVAAVYAQMETYWSSHQADDAVKASQAGKAAANDLAAAAKANDADKAAAAYQTLGGTCKGCHDAHREKLADGTYKIK